MFVLAGLFVFEIQFVFVFVFMLQGVELSQDQGAGIVMSTQSLVLQKVIFRFCYFVIVMIIMSTQLLVLQKVIFRFCYFVILLLL